jgi:hypothetical protein
LLREKKVWKFIGLLPATKDCLDSLKIIERESYNDVILRLIDDWKLRKRDE